MKLEEAHPLQLPRSGLRPAVLAALAALQHRRVTALQACVRSGCTRLTFDAVVDCCGGDDEADNCGDVCAATALRAMLADDGAAGTFLRSQAMVHLALGRGGSASSAFGQLLPPPPRPGSAQPPRRLPPLSPLALLSTAAGELRVVAAGGDSAAAATQEEAALPASGLVCRLHGQYLPLQARGHVACVPPTHAEGVALLDFAPLERERGDDSALRPCPALPRPVLLTRDAAIAAEVAAAATELPADDAAARDALEAAVLALGHALRPGCATPLLARAAIEVLRRGWAAAAHRLVPCLAERLEGVAGSGGVRGHSSSSLSPSQASAPPAPAGGGDGDDVAAAQGVTLLHAAAASGRAELAALVLRCGGRERRFGAAATPGPGGTTPLHLACRADGAAVAELLTAAAGEDDAAAGAVTGHHVSSADGAASALLAWFTAHDDAGRTASHLATAPNACAALTALDAALQQRLRAGSRLARALAAALLTEAPHGAAREAPAARARRAAEVALGGGSSAAPPPLGQVAAAELERATQDARAVAAALLNMAAVGIEERKD